MNLGELAIQLAFEGDPEGLEKFKKKLEDFQEEAEKAVKKVDDLIKKTDENTESVDNNTGATDENTESVDNNAKKVKKHTRGLIALAGALIGAYWAFNRLTKSLIEENQQFINLTRTSDLALATFQKWGSVGKILGVNNAAEQIANLNEKLFDLKLTGNGAQGFMLAGIMPTNAEDVMEQLRTRVSGMSDTAANYLLQQMGLDPSMLHILRMSKEEFTSLNKEMAKFQLTEEQRRSIQVMNAQLQIANQKLEYFKDKVLLKIMPIWLDFVKSFTNIAEGLSKVAKRFSFLNKSGVGFAATLVLITAGIAAIAATIGTKLIPAIKALFLLLKTDPIYLGISAAVTALYLLVDDIMAYFNGGGSIFGTIMNAMEEFQKNGFFSDNVPKWIQTLAEAADKLIKAYGAWKDAQESQDELDNERGTGIITPEMIARASGKGREALEKLFEIQENNFLNESAKAKLIQNLYDKGTINNREIQIEQNNYITTTETAKEVKNGLMFANRAMAQ